MEDRFYGIRGIRLIWHGEWADPELIWHGRSFDYYDLEDVLWNVYEEERGEIGADIDPFPEWVRKHADRARAFLRDMMGAA